jgi:hypothetical protein
MPNGNDSLASSDWAKIRAFFQRYSAVLLDFACAHNLAVDEYYHESPAWLFCFRHPKGGGAHVQLERLDDLNIRIFGAWYVDEYETFTRYLKSTQNRDLRLENIDVRSELEASLNQVVGWEKKELTPHPDYKNVWSRYNKQEWNQIFTAERLPALKP